MKMKLLVQAVAALVVVLGTIMGTGVTMSAMWSDNGVGLHITVLPVLASPSNISNVLSLSGVVSQPSGGGGGGGGCDTTPSIIVDVSVSNITETGADISWRTNEASTSQVEYWSSPSELSPLDAVRVINHVVHLTDLTPGTTYHYKTMSKDLAGNLAVSPEYTFTTLGKPLAASFAINILLIIPTEVDIGEPVNIIILLVNTGGQSGSYEVTLKINGVIEATKEITLNAGASKEVAFTTAKNVAGSYSVEVDGLRGSFTVREKPASPQTPPVTPPEEAPPVKAPTNWPLYGGIIAAVVVVGLSAFFLVRRRRAI